MIRSNLQHIVATEFAELGNFNGSWHDLKIWCSIYFCKKGTLATVFLGTLLDEFNRKISTFNPFLPLSCPSESKRYLHWPPHSPVRSVEKTVMLSAKA